jgi:hypothetical protein
MAVIKIVPFPGPQGSGGSGNIDGGRAGSIYTIVQSINGGNATGQQNYQTEGR